MWQSLSFVKQSQAFGNALITKESLSAGQFFCLLICHSISEELASQIRRTKEVRPQLCFLAKPSFRKWVNSERIFARSAILFLLSCFVSLTGKDFSTPLEFRNDTAMIYLILECLTKPSFRKWVNSERIFVFCLSFRGTRPQLCNTKPSFRKWVNYERIFARSAILLLFFVSLL